MDFPKLLLFLKICEEQEEIQFFEDIEDLLLVYASACVAIPRIRTRFFLGRNALCEHSKSSWGRLYEIGIDRDFLATMRIMRSAFSYLSNLMQNTLGFEEKQHSIGGRPRHMDTNGWFMFTLLYNLIY